MEETILIPIDKLEQINPMLPVLKAIVKVGTRVVVVLRQPRANRHWIAGQWVFIATGMEAMLYGCLDGQTGRAQLQENTARQKMALWQSEIQAPGVTVEVVSCRGSIRPLIAAARRDDRVGLIMTPARSRARRRWPVEQFARLRSLLRLPDNSPVVVLRHI